MRQKQLIQIGTDRGWLRLRWTYQAKRYALTLGLPDGKVNRIAAVQRASQIELDIISGHFDSSLTKYRSEWQKVGKHAEQKIDLAEAIAQFVVYKCDRVDLRTKERYHLLEKQVLEFFGKNHSLDINQVESDRYAKHLFEQHAHRTAAEKVALVRSFFDWAIKQNLVAVNPFIDLPIPRRPHQLLAKPFSHAEVQTILTAFGESETYSHYSAFVAVLFGTGIRLGEAVGLEWSKISSDRSQIEISQSYANGRMKPTKTNRDRTFNLSVSVTKILNSLDPNSEKDSGFVFQSAQGSAIDLHNFRNRAWIKTMAETKIEYRKPYSTRSTFISHALASGMHPLMVAQITGHDPQTMFSHYAGFISSLPTTPELF
jgi:integrase